MKKITCVGYHCTGSGAVDDYLREFSNFTMGKHDYECRLLQDPDGIADLEYNLVENPHRLNSGFALKRFYLYCITYKKIYTNLFGSDWMNIVNEYIYSLSSLQYKGWNFLDIQLLSKSKKFTFKLRKGINKLLPKSIAKSPWYNYFPKLDTYHTNITEEEFLAKTREFIDKLCHKLQPDENAFCVLDQLVNPPNIKRYMRYVNDLQVIVVDRDPRDIYLEETYKYNSPVLPKNPKEFAEVYRDSRRVVNDVMDSKLVLRIHFEDLIYRYDETSKKINHFLGIEEKNHTAKRQFFNPDVSIKNTRLWKKYPQYMEDIKVLEHELGEFLYSYPETKNNAMGE